jgi:hypothetical protein
MRERRTEIHGQLKNHCNVWSGAAATSSTDWSWLNLKAFAYVAALKYAKKFKLSHYLSVAPQLRVVSSNDPAGRPSEMPARA